MSWSVPDAARRPPFGGRCLVAALVLAIACFMACSHPVRIRAVSAPTDATRTCLATCYEKHAYAPWDRASCAQRCPAMVKEAGRCERDAAKDPAATCIEVEEHKGGGIALGVLLTVILVGVLSGAPP